MSKGGGGGGGGAGGWVGVTWHDLELSFYWRHHDPWDNVLKWQLRQWGFPRERGVRRRDLVFSHIQERPDWQEKSQWTVFEKGESHLCRNTCVAGPRRAHSDSHTWSFRPCFLLWPQSSEARFGFQTIAPSARECVACRLYWIWNSLRNHLLVQEKNLPQASPDSVTGLVEGIGLSLSQKPLNRWVYPAEVYLNTSLPFKVLICL